MRWPRSSIFFLFLALLFATGCNDALRTPQETVGVYLKGLKGQDPMRTLEMLTADFHRRHGMTFANTTQLPDDIVLDQSTEGFAEDPEWAAESGRLGWLVAPSQSEAAYTLFPALKQIQLEWLGSEVIDDRAGVLLRAWVEGEASVEFVFQLQRENESAPWKIDSVASESDGGPNARFIQYVIAPNFETMEFIRHEAATRLLKSP